MSPHDEDAEKALIGAMLFRNESIEVVAQFLAGAMFFNHRLGAAYDLIVSMREAGFPADPITVAARMTGPVRLEQWELVQMLGDAALGPLAESYARIIVAHSQRRPALEALDSAVGAIERGAEGPAAMADLFDRFDAAAVSVARSSWAEVDLEPLWDTPAAELFPAPELLRRNDGVQLLAPGATGLLIAPPESAKSMMAMAAVVEAARNGRHSLYVDFESRARRVLPRLAQHVDGSRARGLFHYHRPLAGMTAADRWAIRRRMGELRPQLVILDGYNALLAKHNLDGNKATDIAALAERVVSPWTADDCCTVMIDHVSKDDAKMGGLRMAIGSIAKTGLVDYVISLEVVRDDRIAKGRTGSVALRVAKDRDGELRGKTRDGESFGAFTVRSSADGQWQHAVTMPDGMSGPPVSWRHR